MNSAPLPLTTPRGSTGEELAAARLLYSAAEKLPVLLDLAEHADPADIPDLLNAAAHDSMLGGARVPFMRKLLEKWARLAPVDALDWTRGFGTTAERTDLASAVCKEWARQDAHAAADHAWGAVGFDRSQLLDAVLSTWVGVSPAAAQQWIAALPTSLAQLEIQHSFLHQLARADPLHAADFALSQTDPARLRDVVQIWSQSDPATAVVWALGLPEGNPARAASLLQLADAWAKFDVNGLTRYVATVTDESHRSPLLAAAAVSLAAEDPLAALAWARGLPAEADRLQAASAALLRWSETSPAAAAAHLASQSIQTPGADTIVTILSRWTQSDPVAASQWLRTLADPTQQNNATAAVASQWAHRDPVAANAWLRTLPPGGARDHAIVASILPLAETHPAFAADLGTLITDPATRGSRLQATLESWRDANPTAALAWLARSNLDVALKSQLFDALR